jgi:hypothetical protein
VVEANNVRQGGHLAGSRLCAGTGRTRTLSPQPEFWSDEASDVEPIGDPTLTKLDEVMASLGVRCSSLTSYLSKASLISVGAHAAVLALWLATSVRGRLMSQEVV